MHKKRLNKISAIIIISIVFHLVFSVMIFDYIKGSQMFMSETASKERTKKIRPGANYEVRIDTSLKPHWKQAKTDDINFTLIIVLLATYPCIYNLDYVCIIIETNIFIFLRSVSTPKICWAVLASAYADIPFSLAKGDYHVMIIDPYTLMEFNLLLNTTDITLSSS